MKSIFAVLYVSLQDGPYMVS